MKQSLCFPNTSPVLLFSQLPAASWAGTGQFLERGSHQQEQKGAQITDPCLPPGHQAVPEEPSLSPQSACSGGSLLGWTGVGGAVLGIGEGLKAMPYQK